jgi:hypothetical protein
MTTDPKKHTPGPLSVEIDKSWPFDIVTRNASGAVVFRTRMPCHSTKDKSAADALSARHFDADTRDEASAANHRALADEVIRAAADDLLEACQKSLGVLAGEDMTKQALIDALTLCRAAIAKATGATS